MCHPGPDATVLYTSLSAWKLQWSSAGHFTCSRFDGHLLVTSLAFALTLTQTPHNCCCGCCRPAAVVPCCQRTSSSASAFGLTTTGVGAGQTSADCGLAPGYGFSNGAVRPCPIGTFNAAPHTPNTNTPCTACTTLSPGLTTAKEGGDSTDSCNLCSAGYGGPMCAQTCGGASATYGACSAVTQMCITYTCIYMYLYICTYICMCTVTQCI